jgi:hypothetical protein
MRHIRTTADIIVIHLWLCLFRMIQRLQTLQEISLSSKKKSKNTERFQAVSSILESQDTCRSQVPYVTDRKPNFHETRDKELDLTVIMFSGDTWFHTTGCVNPQNNRFPKLIHEIPLFVTAGVWCAMSETMIIEPIFPEMINENR